MSKKVIKEQILEFDNREFDDWSKGEKNFLLDETGYLFKSQRSYSNQMGYYFSEVRYAYHLINKEKFIKNYIVCENYRLSYSTIQREIDKRNLHALGTKILLDVFSDIFFKAFDKLYDLNKDLIRKPKDRVYVDICAINHKKKIVKFCETKRCDENGRRIDNLNPSQKVCLFFVDYAIKKLGKKAFKNEIIYDVQPRLVVLVPKNVSSQFEPEKYDLCFKV